MRADIMRVVFDFYKKPFLFQFFYDSLSRLITVQSRIFAAVLIDGRIIVHDVDFRQVVPPADFEVVRVMSRRNFYDARTKFHIHILVFNDRNRLIYNGKPYHSAFQISISFIFRMNRHGRIAEHCLRPRRRKFQKFRLARLSVLIHKRVFDMPEMTCLLLIFHFRVRN